MRVRSWRRTVPKPTVYIPQHWHDALGELFPDKSLSELVQVGLIHVIASGGEISPTDLLRALMIIERQHARPNEIWLQDAERAIACRNAGRFLDRVGPPPGVPSPQPRRLTER